MKKISLVVTALLITVASTVIAKQHSKDLPNCPQPGCTAPSGVACCVKPNSEILYFNSFK